MRRGCLEVSHPHAREVPGHLRLDEPTLLFYPRPLTHRFHNPPTEGSDLTCARLDFEGGVDSPLVRALPPLVVLPLARVAGLDLALELLFSEADRVRCGHRLLVDRLFEVVLIQLLRWLLDHPQEAGVRSGFISGMSDVRLARALTAMHDAPGEPWTLARLAGRAAIPAAAATPGAWNLARTKRRRFPARRVPWSSWRAGSRPIPYVAAHGDNVRLGIERCRAVVPSDTWQRQPAAPSWRLNAPHPGG